MRKPILKIVCLFIFCFSGISACMASKDLVSCTRTDAIQAEDGIDRLKDWDTAYQWYKRFAHCDDAAISEGYSDVVGRLLAYKWDDFGEFMEIANSDEKFEQFVLLHLDMTIPVKYYEKMIDNCSDKCPDDGKRLCELIKKKALG